MNKLNILILAIAIILLLVILCIYKSRNYRYKYKIDPNRIEIGKKHLSDSSVVFCGLLKNCSKNIPHIKKSLYDILSKCREYKVLIVENDSTDDTRSKLLEWNREDSNVIVLGCGVNSEYCEIKSIHDNNLKDHSRKRMDKMVYLRNIYLDYIYNNFSHYDYTIVYDFDIKGKLFMDGFYNCFYSLLKNKDINAISPNSFRYYNYLWSSLKQYYDPYAFIKEVPEIDKDYIDDSTKYIDINRIMSDEKLTRVKSAFAGITIYKTKSLYGKYYTTFDIADKSICEHAGLNFQVSNIYIDPKFEYLILDNYT